MLALLATTTQMHTAKLIFMLFVLGGLFSGVLSPKKHRPLVLGAWFTLSVTLSGAIVFWMS